MIQHTVAGHANQVRSPVRERLVDVYRTQETRSSRDRRRPGVLTAATLGMAGYGLYAAGTGVAGLLGDVHLELWAALLQIGLGFLLVLAGAFVRVQLPGGLALALGALLGLQALALHGAAHIYGFIAPVPQAARAMFAALLMALAFFGAKAQRPRGLGTATDA